MVHQIYVIVSVTSLITVFLATCKKQDESILLSVKEKLGFDLKSALGVVLYLFYYLIREYLRQNYLTTLVR